MARLSFLTRRACALLSFLTVVGLLLLSLAACGLTPAQQAALPTDTAPPPTHTLTQAPSATPEPTATPVPTDTPEPTPTDTPAPTATSTPDRTATEQARATAAAEAMLGVIGEELEHVGLTTDTGYLLWMQENPEKIAMSTYQEWVYKSFAEGLTASDFVLKTDVTWESSSGLVTCELRFRTEKNLEEGKYYLFEMYRLSGLPAWFISYIRYGEFQKSITEFRTTSAIKQDQGSTNKIVLITEGERFTLYINDVRLGSFYDYSKSMLDGYFAFGAWQESGNSSCTFSDTWVWALK
jgi:hypothetical protein